MTGERVKTRGGVASTPVKVDFPFTVCDTPDVRTRVVADIGLVTRLARERDPRLIALALTGGFARGEGSVIDGRPVNDYDFVAIRSRIGGQKLYARIGEDASRDVGIHVDILPISLARLKRVAPKVFWFDTRESGRVVWGNATILSRIPDFRAVDIPPTEAIRLLANRAAGLLEVTGENGPRAHGHHLHLQASKALLAVQDARLIAAGHYHASYRERARRYRLIETSERARAWTGWATVYKLDPARALEVDAHDLWESARSLLLAEYGRTLKLLGYAHPVQYANTRPPSPLERLYYVVQVLTSGKRGHANPFASQPSARVAALGAVLLLTSGETGAHPLGVREARKLLRPFGHTPDDYEGMIERLFALRALTLQ